MLQLEVMHKSIKKANETTDPSVNFQKTQWADWITYEKLQEFNQSVGKIYWHNTTNSL